MKSGLRTVGELLLFTLLVGVSLVAVIAVIRLVFDDEKTQYFCFGYYVAVHHKLVHWIWKRLCIEKPETSP